MRLIPDLSLSSAWLVEAVPTPAVLEPGGPKPPEKKVVLADYHPVGHFQFLGLWETRIRAVPGRKPDLDAARVGVSAGFQFHPLSALSFFIHADFIQELKDKMFLTGASTGIFLHPAEDAPDWGLGIRGRFQVVTEKFLMRAPKSEGVLLASTGFEMRYGHDSFLSTLGASFCWNPWSPDQYSFVLSVGLGFQSMEDASNTDDPEPSLF